MTNIKEKGPTDGSTLSEDPGGVLVGCHKPQGHRRATRQCTLPREHDYHTPAAGRLPVDLRSAGVVRELNALQGSGSFRVFAAICGRRRKRLVSLSKRFEPRGQASWNFSVPGLQRFHP